jgi:hypothetical protein
VEPATPYLGQTDATGPRTRIILGRSSLPVAVQGGPAREEMILNASAPITVDTGDGDDRLNVSSPNATVLAGPGNDRLTIGQGPTAAGRAPWRVDAGPGNDSMLAFVPDDSLVLGGSGDDTLNVSTENQSGEFAVTRQRLDCGDGADLATIDAADVVGPGCGPAPRGVKRDMTVGTFGDTGAIRMAVGRVSRPTRVRIGMSGPKPPGLNSTSVRNQVPYTAFKVLPRIAGAVRTTVTPVASVRRRLRTRRTAVRNVFVTMQLSAPGLPAGDRTSLFMRGALRRGA